MWVATTKIAEYLPVDLFTSLPGDHDVDGFHERIIEIPKIRRAVAHLKQLCDPLKQPVLLYPPSGFFFALHFRPSVKAEQLGGRRGTKNRARGGKRKAVSGAEVVFARRGLRDVMYTQARLKLAPAGRFLGCQTPRIAQTDAANVGFDAFEELAGGQGEKTRCFVGSEPIPHPGSMKGRLECPWQKPFLEDTKDMAAGLGLGYIAQVRFPNDEPLLLRRKQLCRAASNLGHEIRKAQVSGGLVY